MLGIDALGYEPFQKTLYLETWPSPHGMILVTGPTGSGKTVSLYTGLNILNTEDTNISTAEDPVEINLPGVNQVNVNPKVGLTFASALRAFLRQDPDVIMVGEIRDLETAEIAIKAAQTGHLVLSTLHTNDAPQTLTRLVDMGVKPYAIATSVSLIIAQRLARRLCKHCKAPLDVPAEALLKEGFPEEEIATGIEIFAPRRLHPVHRRLQGPRRHLPGDAGHRGHRPHHHGRRQCHRHQDAGRREGVWDLRRAGPATRSARAHQPRRNQQRDGRLRDRRQTTLWPNSIADPSKQIPLPLGRQGQERQPDQGPRPRQGRGRGARRPAPPGRRPEQGQERTPAVQGRGQGQRRGHRDVQPPAGHHAGGRHSAGAGLRDRRRRPRKAGDAEADPDIKADIEGGTSLHEALAKHPLYFDDLFVNLVEAGEQAGALEALLDKVATYKEKTEALKKKIKKALFYPAAVLVVAVIVTVILLIFVIPQFESLFKGFGADLPAFTQMVIDLSKFVQDKGWLHVDHRRCGGL